MIILIITVFALKLNEPKKRLTCSCPYFASQWKICISIIHNKSLINIESIQNSKPMAVHDHAVYWNHTLG